MASANAVWSDATNATRKAKLQLSAYDTAIRTGIEIRANGTTPDIALLGDTWFEGAGFGLPYGSCSSDATDLAWSQVATTDTWYDISDTGMGDGQLNLVTHDGSGKLTVAKAGTYLVNYNMGLEVSVANKHIFTAISIDGTENAQGQDHYENKAISQEFSMGSTAILALTAGQTINLSVKLSDVVGATILVDRMNITVVMVGG
jgi:hypothetical protein